MTITREVAIRLLGTDTKKFPQLVEQGKINVVRVGWGGRKYYDRDQVIKVAKELGKIKEL